MRRQKKGIWKRKEREEKGSKVHNSEQKESKSAVWKED